jgi:hypothetical protein
MHVLLPRAAHGKGAPASTNASPKGELERAIADRHRAARAPLAAAVHCLLRLAFLLPCEVRWHLRSGPATATPLALTRRSGPADKRPAMAKRRGMGGGGGGVWERSLEVTTEVTTLECCELKRWPQTGSIPNLAPSASQARAPPSLLSGVLAGGE